MVTNWFSSKRSWTSQFQSYVIITIIAIVVVVEMTKSAEEQTGNSEVGREGWKVWVTERMLVALGCSALCLYQQQCPGIIILWWFHELLPLQEVKYRNHQQSLLFLVAACEAAVKSLEKGNERRNGWPLDILRKGFTLRGYNISERKHLWTLFLTVLRAATIFTALR